MPLKPGDRLARRTRLKPVSAKRRAEAPARARVVAVTKERAGHRCEARELVPEVECGGQFDTDEIKGRGVNPGGHLDDTNTQLLCRRHHDWKTTHPMEARRRGLRKRATDA